MFSAQVGTVDSKIEQARARQAQMEYARQGGGVQGGFQDHVEDSRYAEDYDQRYDPAKTLRVAVSRCNYRPEARSGRIVSILCHSCVLVSAQVLR